MDVICLLLCIWDLSKKHYYQFRGYCYPIGPNEAKSHKISDLHIVKGMLVQLVQDCLDKALQTSKDTLDTACKTMMMPKKSPRDPAGPHKAPEEEHINCVCTSSESEPFLT